jgi:hypothetical protein
VTGLKRESKRERESIVLQGLVVAAVDMLGILSKKLKRGENVFSSQWCYKVVGNVFEPQSRFLTISDVMEG